MALNPQILFAMIQELAPDNTELWQTITPTFEHIAGLKKERTVGTHFEFPVTTRGPASASTIRQGADLIQSGNTMEGVVGREDTTRVIVSFNVFQKDIDEQADTPQGYKELYKELPEAAMIQFAQQANKQLLSGIYSAGDPSADPNFDLSGLMTFNGNVNYFPVDLTDARAGYFHAAAPTAQTATVYGLASSGASANPITGWHNQYLNYSNLELQGVAPIIGLQRTISRQGKQLKQPHLAICDGGSYLALMQAHESRVRFASVDASEQNAKHYNARSAVALAGIPGIVWQSDDDIDFTLSTFNSVQRTGLAYLLDDSWTLKYREAKSIPGLTSKQGSKKVSIFEVREPQRLPYQDGYRIDMVCHIQPVSRCRRSQAVITGLINN